MRISTKGRYALRLMLDLALNGTDNYITIKSIAKRQDISEKYLEQIITQLNRAGFVNSARGAQGGYRLAHSTEKYTVGEILRTMEGTLAPAPCLGEVPCLRGSECVTFEIWQELETAINNVIDNITLADLVARQKNKTPLVYNI